MPLQKCENDGVKWGDKGKCYHGKDKVKKAMRQGYAEDPKHFQDIMKSEGYSRRDIHEIITELPTLKEE